jgi:hypothetical protein
VAEKTVAEKARVKPGAAIAVINRIPGMVESLGLPANVTFVKPADAQLVFLFARTRAELERLMPRAVAGMASGAAIWVFFRKGSKDAGLDMNRDSVWAVAEQLDLRPLGLVSVDETWATFRLRRATRDAAPPSGPRARRGGLARSRPRQPPSSGSARRRSS